MDWQPAKYYAQAPILDKKYMWQHPAPSFNVEMLWTLNIFGGDNIDVEERDLEYRRVYPSVATFVQSCPIIFVYDCSSTNGTDTCKK